MKKILEEDDGLLDTPPKQVPISSEDRLIGSFLEINSYIENNGHAPYPNSDDIGEKKLYSRLNGIVSDPEKLYKLKPYDTFKILKPSNDPKSVDDILENDDLGIFESDADDLFTIKNIPKDFNRPEYVGRQKKCLDFENFESLFLECHRDIKNGKRKIVDFRHQRDIVEGNYFVLKGVLVYVDRVGEKEKAVNGLDDARLRLIYENGTESDILLLSFAKALFLDGKLVTEHEDKVLDNFKGLDHKDKDTGYIYVLSSLSDLTEIKNMNNLYKIGFTTKDVEERIKGAEKDPTYLMSPVKIVATYKCYNLSAQRFEHLLHRVFAGARLDLEVIGLNKEKFIPDEWFVVPLEIIDQAISLIISDEIIDYEYDLYAQRLTGKGGEA